MHRYRFFANPWLSIAAAAAIAVAIFVSGEALAAEPISKADRHFTLQVLPVLKAKCLACHGEDGDDLKGDFDLSSRAALLKGGESGEPGIVPKQPDEGTMLSAIRWEGYEMPPKENDRLSVEQIAAIERWIREGAVWPNADIQKRIVEDSWKSESSDQGVIVATSGGLSDDWTYRRYQPKDLWAYQPRANPAVPEIASAAGAIEHPIDAFLQRRMSEAGVTPAGPADRVEWIRRITFNVTGLPPTPDEVTAYVEDRSVNADQRVIDRLLASPHYGERMAQHWLDVVRYADTAGYANDFSRPNAWRYRDYVIRSFNSDKPFDQFIREQIAGDEIDPDDPEMLIAVGFLRMGPWEHTGMSVFAETRQLFLDDAVNTVGETFLATNMSCFKCHDHKFDPLPTQDYYRMQAAFAPVQLADRPAPFLPEENTTGMSDQRRRYEQLAKNDGTELIIPPGADEKLKRELRKDFKRIQNKNREQHRRTLLMTQPRAFSVYNGPLNPKFRSTKSIHEVPNKRSGEVQQVSILVGGSIASPSTEVEPGVLSAVDRMIDEERNSSLTNEMTGRRTELAAWIASDANPLTARVYVNRIWQWHFGRGLVNTPNNFGVTGSEPTHPELLDWLANYFIEQGWSTKAVHRLILTSDAYRRSTSHPQRDAVDSVDPNNELLSWFPPRRLTAEELRDSMLVVSGDLNAEMGGIPIRPEINRDVAFQPRMIMGGVAPAYQPSRTPLLRNRRTIYAQKIRGLRDPMLEVFDQPTPDQSCGRRNASTVTPQVFALFNSESVHHRALAFAVRLIDENASPKQRIQSAYRLCFGREPSKRDLMACLDHIGRSQVYHSAKTPPPIELPTELVRERLGEQFGHQMQWLEQLDVYKNYEPDLTANMATAEQRAWAELCLVLLNSNEFAYVY
ncbi:PSD1 and planctomycete cytochrome C domain-containing protein [Stratiformator vulcanicus]|nr:PSD1 and planctomycete cytochrome C domain-containing protein [Stratiformator vulcanicus]